MDKIFSELLTLYQESTILSKIFIKRSLSVIPYLKIESYVPEKGKILDFGSGHGIFSNIMALRSSKRNVTGCDIDDHKIKIAAKTIYNRKNIHFCKKDIMDFHENFDVVVMISILYLISYDKQEKILRHILSLLTENGKLIIVEFDKKPKWKYYFGYFRELLMTTVYTKREGLFFRSSDEYFSLFRQLNLSTEKYCLHMPMYSAVIYVCSKQV